jgi:RND family efflux transporter MFP subunit
MKALARLIAALLGAALLLGGIGAVLFVDWNPLPPAPPTPVRPVKVAPVRDLAQRPAQRFPGYVQPGRWVDLAFQVSGQLLESNLALGRQVRQGEVLARIDPVRLQQQVATLEPLVVQSQVRWERLSRLVPQGAATQQELTDAKAALDNAQANLDVAKQALADAVLRAPFDALVVQRFVENFQNLNAGAPVVRLQDISEVQIAIDLPESVVALRKRGTPVQWQVEFPVRPDRRYDVTYKEASADADPRTLTYRVVMAMPSPDDLMVLPGMAATVVAPSISEGSPRLAVPMQALFQDEAGQTSVWVLSGQGPTFNVARAAVSSTTVQDTLAVIDSGLQAGQQVVIAGVPFLRQGQSVRVMEGRP